MATRGFVPGTAVFLSDSRADCCLGRTFVEDEGALCISLERLPDDLVGIEVILHLRAGNTAEDEAATESQRVSRDGSLLIRIPRSAGALYEVAHILVDIEVVADSA